MIRTMDKDLGQGTKAMEKDITHKITANKQGQEQNQESGPKEGSKPRTKDRDTCSTPPKER